MAGLSPGRRRFVQYAGLELLHERLLLCSSGYPRWAICTPDLDAYVEHLQEFDFHISPLTNDIPRELADAEVYSFAGLRTLAINEDWENSILFGVVSAQLERAADVPIGVGDVPANAFAAQVGARGFNNPLDGGRLAGGDGGIVGAPAGLEIGVAPVWPGFIWIIASLPLDDVDLPWLGAEHVLLAKTVRLGDAGVDRIGDHHIGIRLVAAAEPRRYPQRMAVAGGLALAPALPTQGRLQKLQRERPRRQRLLLLMPG